jgi:hypothetical protein
MAWLYVPGSEDSNSDSGLPLGSSTELYVTLNGTPTRRPYSWRGWKTRPWIKRLSGTRLSLSTAQRGADAFILSLPDFPVSRSPSPASAGAPKTIAGSGLPLLESFATWSHGSCFLRMSRRLFEEECSTYLEPWPSSGSMRSGTCFWRPKRARRTGGSDCLFWPTATADGGKRGQIERDSPNWEIKIQQRRINGAGLISDDLASSAAAWATPSARDWKCGDASETTMEKNARPLNEQAVHWPTPNTRDSADTARHTTATGIMHPGTTLTDAVRLWPTPTAQDYGTNHGGAMGRTGPVRPSLSTLVRSHPAPPIPKDGNDGSPPEVLRPRLRLNVAFVEMLMGFPLGWTDARIGCELLETPSCPNAPHSRLQNCGDE